MVLNENPPFWLHKNKKNVRGIKKDFTLFFNQFSAIPTVSSSYPTVS